MEARLQSSQPSKLICAVRLCVLKEPRLCHVLQQEANLATENVFSSRRGCVVASRRRRHPFQLQKFPSTRSALIPRTSRHTRRTNRCISVWKPFRPPFLSVLARHASLFPQSSLPNRRNTCAGLWFWTFQFPITDFGFPNSKRSLKSGGICVHLRLSAVKLVGSPAALATKEKTFARP